MSTYPNPLKALVLPTSFLDGQAQQNLRAISRANTDRRLPELHVSAKALAKLRWSAEKNDNEFTFWGVIDVDQESGRFVMKDAILAKHASNSIYCDPDMEWYGDLVMDKFEGEGLQPWQLACWIHTHPRGMDHPSGPDIETFERSLGDQRLSLMVIMTKDLKFWARMSAIVQPFDGVSAKTYSASPLRVTFEDPEAKVAAELAAELDALYPTLWEAYIPPAVQYGGRDTLVSALRESTEQEDDGWAQHLSNYFNDADEEEENYLIEDEHLGVAVTRRQVLNFLAFHAETGADGALVFKSGRVFDLEDIADSLLDSCFSSGPTIAEAVVVRNALRQLVMREDIIQGVKNALAGK